MRTDRSQRPSSGKAGQLSKVYGEPMQRPYRETAKKDDKKIFEENIFEMSGKDSNSNLSCRDNLSTKMEQENQELKVQKLKSAEI